MSEEDVKSNANASMWAKSGDAYVPCDEAVSSLPPSQYTIETSQDRGIYFSQKMTNIDDLLLLPDSATDSVLWEIEEFWKREEIYRNYRYLWKRGVLLWGPPGSGKTSTVQLISKRIVDRGGIAVYVTNPKIAARGLTFLRKIEPKRPVVVILEDIDAIANHYESEILALLDGELQIDNVVFVATTNYPEKLDRRIVNRPSRFDLVKKVPMPNPRARKMYLLNREPSLADQARSIDRDECDKINSAQAIFMNRLLRELSEMAAVQARAAGATLSETKNMSEMIYKDMKIPDKIDDELRKKISSIHDDLSKLKSDTPTARTISEVDYWVSLTEDFSVAHLKEVVLGVKCFGKPVEEVVGRMRKMINNKPSSSSVDATF